MTSTRKGQARLRLVVDNERGSDGGYRSGRNSWRDMPDAASTERTRSAGTRPDLRHFCTAWYRTPSLAAKGCSPPPASIARLTASMRRSLQLTGVIRQQPARVSGLGSMQLMVAKPEQARIRAQEAFSDELNRQLELREAPARGRPAWLKKQLKARVKLDISVTTGQKWLGGLQIPRGWKLMKLIEAFSLDVEPLMKAGDLVPGDADDDRLATLRQLWPHITDDHDRDALLRMAYRSAGIPVPEIAEAPSIPSKKTASKG